MQRNAAPKKAKPASLEVETNSPAWSVPNTLSFIAPELGVVGKLDTIEVDDGEVIVVEAKHGRAPKFERHTWQDYTLDFGAWPADVAQVAIYMAMLREHGLECSQARTYYRKSKASRTVTWSDDVERFVHATSARPTRLRFKRRPPEPLLDSPKCVGCSLHGVCLPDEHHALKRLESAAEAPTEPVRRVVPARDDKSVLHLMSPGTLLRKRGDSLVVCLRTGDEHKVPVKDVNHVAICVAAVST